ncbi:hypothetical protein P280DRAFT_472893 [Massarina eburnea CBS 473.64]|uniref:Glycosyltransferase family 34 protein n=1 Tax=Massarina eburnea CBS 473.64 TaxID=1395130 RepID=A0A6A6RQZ7_9PLEO|nr:hypothetical protein P280DRAFT_472893 [Massarina eburnea CBS 473.64]
MLTRSPRVPPSLFVFLIICFFAGYYHFTPLSTDIDPFLASSGQTSSPSKNGPRIGIVTFVTEERSYLHASLMGKAHYARRHGYDLIVDYEAHADRGIMWWKFEMITRLIRENKYDWLWWIDFDTLITNTDIKVADIIEETLANATAPDEIDYLLTHDCNGLNMGSFIARAHERSVKFFKDTSAIETHGREKGESMSEQDAMVRLLETDPATAHRAIQVPQWKLNAFPDEISCFDEHEIGWKPGTFVLHFAGAWAHVKGEDPTGQLMRKYETEVVWGDWKELYPGPGVTDEYRIVSCNWSRLGPEEFGFRLSEGLSDGQD